MKIKLALGAFAAAMILSACGNKESETTVVEPVAPVEEAPAPAPAPEATAPVVDPNAPVAPAPEGTTPPAEAPAPAPQH